MFHMRTLQAAQTGQPRITPEQAKAQISALKVRSHDCGLPCSALWWNEHVISRIFTEAFLSSGAWICRGATSKVRLLLSFPQQCMHPAQGMSPEQLEAVSRQNFTPGQTASREDLAKTAAMLQVSGSLCSQGQRDRAMAKNEHGDAMSEADSELMKQPQEMMRMRRLEDKATFSGDSVTYDVQLQHQSVASHRQTQS